MAVELRTVGLTAAQSGGDTDYSLSAGSATSQPGSFSGASFSVGASGSSLVSGSDPTSYSYALTYEPNGDIATANDSVNGNWTYTYDDFNRLASSSCSGACPDGQGTQAFGYVYDRYANRWQQNVTAGAGPQPVATFNNTKNQLDGYSYDADGNLTNDGVQNRGKTRGGEKGSEQRRRAAAGLEVRATGQARSGRRDIAPKGADRRRCRRSRPSRRVQSHTHSCQATARIPRAGGLSRRRSRRRR